MSITEKKRFGNNVRLPGANHFVHAYTYLPKHCLNFKACRSLLNWKNARSNVKKLMFSFPVYGSFSVRYFLTCCNNNRKVREKNLFWRERESWKIIMADDKKGNNVHRRRQSRGGMFLLSCCLFDVDILLISSLYWWKWELAIK